MKMRRGIFISALLVLFLCCYHIMNQHYDELSRYQYANEDNRKLILEYMTTEDINYLIDRQYRPEEFMEYLGLPYFNIRYVDWYNRAKSEEHADSAFVLQLVDVMKEEMTYSKFKTYCKHYTLAQLFSFYVEDHAFVHDFSLIADPSAIHGKISDHQTLFMYEPKDLVEVESVPIVNQMHRQENIFLKKDASEALTMMCKAAFEINDKTCGNMIVTDGYRSFDEQEYLYEEAVLTYGIDEVSKYADYPGQSIYQLGNVVRLVLAGSSEQEEDELSIQQQWLSEHAQEYGFRFINDPSHPLKEFILQYDEQLTIHEKGEGME